MNHRLILVGCVARKRGVPAAAAELYVSPLFRKRRRFAIDSVRSGRASAWAILSARHGLVWPDDVLEPYDTTIAAAAAAGLIDTLRLQVFDEVADWTMRLGSHEPSELVVEMHAGAPYRTLLARLELAGVVVEHPVAGLQVGQQLAHYNRRP